MSDCQHCGGFIPLGPDATNRCNKCGRGYFNEPPKHPLGHWLVLFEDTSVPPAIFPTEALARKFYEDRSVNWNCHLFRGVESNFTDSTWKAGEE